MDFTSAVKSVLGNYVTFSGRAPRSEYWWFTLFSVVVSIVLTIVEAVFTGATENSILSGLFSLAILLPSLAVVSRRLHDVDRSFWWFLLIFIPLIGALVLLYWFVQRGTQGDNRFGPDPLDPRNFGSNDGITARSSIPHVER